MVIEVLVMFNLLWAWFRTREQIV